MCNFNSFRCSEDNEDKTFGASLRNEFLLIPFPKQNSIAGVQPVCGCLEKA